MSPDEKPAVQITDTEPHPVQTDVEEFHEAVGAPVGDPALPGVQRAGLRQKLLQEECAEAIEAIGEGDLAHIAKELCDVLCVTYGAAIEFGLNLKPFWDEVHASNMAKTGGPVREDGKVMKPEGWQPPDMKAVLKRQIEDHSDIR